MSKVIKFWGVSILLALILGVSYLPCSAAQLEGLEGVIAYIELDGDIYLLILETNTRVQLTDDADLFQYQHPKISPDGQMLAFLKNNPEKGNNIFDLHVMDLENKNTKLLVENVDSWGSFNWSPDSQSIVYGYSLDVVCKNPGEDTALGIFEVIVDSGNSEEIIPARENSTPLKEPFFSDDGNWLTYKSYPCFSEGWNIHTLNLQSGESHNYFMSELDWSPGENTLAWTQEISSGVDGSVYLVSADQSWRELNYTPDNLTAAAPHWSPDGKWLLLRQYTIVEEFFFSEEETEEWIDELVLVNDNGRLIETLCSTQTVNACQFQAWSPFGNAVIFSIDEGTQIEWQLYSLETGSFTTLAEFGDGGIDWAKNVQLPKVDMAITSPITSQEAPIPISLEKQKESNPNIQVLIGTGIFSLILGLFIIIFLIIYLKQKNYL